MFVIVVRTPYKSAPTAILGGFDSAKAAHEWAERTKGRVGDRYIIFEVENVVEDEGEGPEPTAPLEANEIELPPADAALQQMALQMLAAIEKNAPVESREGTRSLLLGLIEALTYFGAKAKTNAELDEVRRALQYGYGFE